ncbi:MAG: DUF3347 domain-containing protein [Bacteroidota bacterium]
MKKILIGIIVLALAAFAVDKFFFAKPGNENASQPKKQPLAISKNSGAFNDSFEQLLGSYFSLKDAIANYDTARANAAAKEMVVFADSLKTNEIKGDSAGDIRKTAEDFSGTISGSAKGLQGEPDLTKKKREFQMISEALYNLIRTVRYDRQKLYHQHCPMAFGDNEEAWWISNSNKIDNPYLGRKHPKYKAAMADCGDITDSLDFSK